MRILWSLEKDGGKVNWHRFYHTMLQRQRNSQKEACRAIFDVFDFDNDGTISVQELQETLTCETKGDPFRVGLETLFGMPAEQLQARVARYAEESEYTFEKFFKMMRNTCDETPDTAPLSQASSPR